MHCNSAPQSYSSILRGGSEQPTFAIQMHRFPGKTRNPFCVPLQYLSNEFISFAVPNANEALHPSGNQVLPSGAPGYAEHPIGMPAIKGGQWCLSISVPENYSGISGSCGNNIALVPELNCQDWLSVPFQRRCLASKWLNSV